VSTDEVYGSLGPDDAPFHEDTPYAPNSPYSASKAGSDHLVRAYHVDGTPSLIINGKYRVTGLAERGIGFPEMVQLTLDLVKQEAEAKKVHK